MRTARTVVLLALLTTGCAMPAAPQQTAPTLLVFAASSLTEAFSEIGAGFEAQYPGVQVNFSFAGSQTLRTQIQAGAPADVFASASPDEMQALVATGLVAPDAPRQLLSNRLVVILPPKNPGAVEQLQDLARPGLKLVLTAEEVPVGDYSRRALRSMDAAFGPGFAAQVLANVVSNEDNVKQVVAKVELGEADAAIVYVSDAVAAPDVRTIEIPADLNATAQYPIAALLASKHAVLSESFVDYVLSQAGQSVLKKWGFGPPD